MKSKRFYDSLYGATYYIYIGGTSKEFKKRLLFHKVKLGKINPKDYAYFKGIETKKCSYCFIWCKSNNIIYLAHECLHATTYVFKNIGIPINKKTDEAACYYQQWILEEIKDKFSSAPKKRLIQNQNL